jgi:hypothetical protein
MAVYEGIGGVARQVANMYKGIGGVARQVVKGWKGISGVAREFYAGGFYWYSYGTLDSNIYTSSSNISAGSNYLSIIGTGSLLTSYSNIDISKYTKMCVCVKITSMAKDYINFRFR